MSDIEFGDKVADTVTGFKGIVTALAQYSTGCNQVLVTPKVSKSGTLSESGWFDVERIEVVKKKAKEITSSPSGGSRHSDTAPIR